MPVGFLLLEGFDSGFSVFGFRFSVKSMEQDSYKSRSYRDLEVWLLSIDFVKKIYRVTNNFPASEKYGLTNQIRRAAVSIPSNIAEGQGSNSTKEFKQFLAISLGSLAE
jgi:hypothetical protein